MPAILSIFIPVLTWIFREVVIKFVLFSAVFALVGFFAPYVITYLGNFIVPGGLTSAFTGLPAGMWWLIDMFRLDFGLPLIISAFVSRFLIRRLPFIG